MLEESTQQLAEKHAHKRMGELLRSNEKLRLQVEQLEAAHADLQHRHKDLQQKFQSDADSRRAALNLMEDAMAARRAEQQEYHERIRAEEDLRASEKKFRTLFTSIDEGFYLVEFIGEDFHAFSDVLYLDENPAAIRTVGKTIKGRRLSELEPHWERFWRGIFAKIAKNGDSQRFERYTPMENIWLDFYIFKPDPINHGHHVAIVFNNITGRKRAENHLRRAAEADAYRVALADTLRLLNDPAEIQTQAAKILARNLKVSGVYYAEHLDAEQEPLLLSDEIPDLFPEIISQTNPFRFEDYNFQARAEYQAGHVVWCHNVANASISPEAKASLERMKIGAWVTAPIIRNAHPIARLVVHHSEPHEWTAEELTMIEETAERIGFSMEHARAVLALQKSRKDLWEALQESRVAREAAEQAKAAKDNFLAVLSHELRTPLTPVLLASETLLWEENLSEPVIEALEMINRNIRLEAQFIDDLLDVTRIERGKLELNKEPLNLHEIISDAVEVSLGDIQAKKQTLEVSLEATELQMEGDALRLRQVFWNLLKNASKFTPAGGKITLHSFQSGENLVVTIRDSGIGFPPEAAARIFDPFSQADAQVTRKFGGLGLGLAIAKATVQGHSGTLTANSPGPGKGATFNAEFALSVNTGKAGT